MTSNRPPGKRDPACPWCRDSTERACAGHRNGWGVASDAGWQARHPDWPQQCAGYAKTRAGRCERPAHRGQIVCGRHGGSSPQALAGGKRRTRRAGAVAAVATYGLPVESTPEQALLDELYRTVGHVAYLGAKVRELDAAGLKQLDAVGRFERPSVWVELYQAERQHLARVAKDCISAGIEERQVRTMEAFAADLTGLLRRYVDVIAEHFGLTAEQRAEADGLMLAELRAIEGGKP